MSKIDSIKKQLKERCEGKTYVKTGVRHPFTSSLKDNSGCEVRFFNLDDKDVILGIIEENGGTHCLLMPTNDMRVHGYRCHFNLTE